MASQHLNLPDVTIQKADIQSSLDLGLLGTLMTGMYTIIYFGTLYICLRGEKARNKFVIWTISLLYACGIAECGIEWAFLHWSFLKNGDARANVFVALLAEPGWLHVMNNIFAFAMIILADMLLGWRCYHVWNQSIRVILVPLFLFFAEICLFFSAVVILFVAKAQPNHHQALTVNGIGSSGYFISAITSLVVTFLIAYRINSVTKDGLAETRGRFKQIIEIVIQSVLVYSLAQLVEAIVVVVPLSIGNTHIFALDNYSGTILLPITGIAPTIMVARVKLAAEESEMKTASFHVTDLNFRAQESTTRSSEVQYICHQYGSDGEKVASASHAELEA